MLGKRKRVPKISGIRKKWNHKQQFEEKEKTAFIRDWVVGLPDHLIELVIEKLSVFDCLSFGSVCKSWSNITIKLFDGSSRGIPLLVKYGPNENTTRTCLNVLDKKSKIFPSFKLQLPEDCRGSHIWGSFQDWLFLGIVDGLIFHISLLLPFSGVSIALPDVYEGAPTMIMSTIPTDPKCICMILSSFEVSVCTPGAKKWLQITSISGDSAFYLEGHFYLPISAFKLAIVSEKNILKAFDDGTCETIPRNEIQFRPTSEPHPAMRTHRVYKVGSCRDMLLVRRFLYMDGPRRNQTSHYEIYKLDFIKIDWVKFESLRDQILFLSNCIFQSFSANELGDCALKNVSKNRVCFFINEVKWDRLSHDDHWIAAPLSWCLKEKFGVEHARARSGRTTRVPSHLANYIM